MAEDSQQEPSPGADPNADQQIDSVNGRANRTEEAASPEAASVDLAFQDEALDEKLEQASTATLDTVDFGIIQVDDEGTILFFNQYESNLSGVDPEEAVGQNFFTEVAPCTNNRLFRGRFRKGLDRNDLDETFTYTYTYRMQPTLVTIHLYRDSRNDNWIMVKKY